jgi:hypothetical protein
MRYYENEKEMITMESGTQSPIELRVSRMYDQLKAHESIVNSLQRVIQCQQKLLERLASLIVAARNPSLLENLGMDKLAKISLFAFSLTSKEKLQKRRGCITSASSFLSFFVFGNFCFPKISRKLVKICSQFIICKRKAVASHSD